MSYTLEHNVSLKSYSGLHIGGIAKNIYIVSDKKDLIEIFKSINKEKTPWMIIGDGSNTVFSDNIHEIAFIKITEDNINYIDNSNSCVKASAGTHWDDLVIWCIKNNLQGLEALSAIPGTVGAAPVQNIGAYGSQFSDVCKSVDVYDVENGIFRTLESRECCFNYRDSIFKHEEGKNLIVVSITLQLKNSSTVPIPEYPDVQKYFNDNTKPTLYEVRDAITTIRWSKLPKPSELPNTGSFFKNPTISKALAEQLSEQNYKLPQFPTDDPNIIKTSAGWLVEQVGMKGYRHGNIGTYDKHALVIVNHEGSGNYKELSDLITIIKEKVYDKFKINLETEVNIIT